MLLSTREVAERLKVDVNTVTQWCRLGAIWPAMRLAGGWAIDPCYIVMPLKPHVAGPGRPRIHPVQPPSGRGRGRPPGAKNLKPYPKGVKRPRKPK